MSRLYVVDTCALISYFSEHFENADVSVSNNCLEIIDNAFFSSDIKLIFPSTIFIEIFKKWFKSEEQRERINMEVYYRIKTQENMEIQPLDKEILANFISITDIESNHNFDNHDKQILAAAITMNCPLLSSDKRIIRYNKRKNVIPEIII